MAASGARLFSKHHLKKIVYASEFKCKQMKVILSRFIRCPETNNLKTYICHQNSPQSCILFFLKFIAHLHLLFIIIISVLLILLLVRISQIPHSSSQDVRLFLLYFSGGSGGCGVWGLSIIHLHM